IMCHLAEKSGSALWPRDSHVLADTLRWLFFCSCHIDPYLTTLVVERFIKRSNGAPEDTALTADAERWLGRFLPVLEQHLTGQQFVTGSFGLADIALGCSLELSDMLRLDLSPYANVRAWLQRLQGRASWRACTVPMPT